MKKQIKVMLVALIAVASIAAASIIRWHWNRASARREFSDLLNRDGVTHIASITFSGQRRVVNVTDPAVLSEIEACLRQPRVIAGTGIAYDAVIRFASGGASAHVGVYVRDDNLGFTIANYYNENAGDPEYIGISCSRSIDGKVSALLSELTAKNN